MPLWAIVIVGNNALVDGHLNEVLIEDAPMVSAIITGGKEMLNADVEMRQVEKLVKEARRYKVSCSIKLARKGKKKDENDMETLS